jgi:hypothetical protein
VLGFATADVSKKDGVLMIWLTPPMEGGVTHTNAVTFPHGDSFQAQLAWGMLVDRYVVLTARTNAADPVFDGWDVAPADIDTLVAEVRRTQDAVLDAVTAQRGQRGKGVLAEPTLPAVPSAVDQRASKKARPADLTLAVANWVAAVWVAWIGTERERVRRLRYMPEELSSANAELLPTAFVARFSPYPRFVLR